MRRLFFSILLAASVFTAFYTLNIPAARATNTLTQCYCRYSDLSTLSGVDNEDALFCPNEIGTGESVEGGLGAEARCRIFCQDVGQEFVKVSDKNPSEYGTPKNIIKDETDICVFSKDDIPSIDGWTSAYGNCKLPLNSIRKSSFPDSCSFCFCDIKAGTGVPAACVGRSTMVHVTSNPEGCSVLCGKLGFDGGSVAKKYNDKCDYKVSNGCSAPLNPTDGCKSSLTGEATTEAYLGGQGTVLSLPLPLSNISVEKAIGRILNAVLGVVGAIALLIFVWAGFSWMLAAGSQEKIGKAKQSMLWAALGLLAIFSSYAVLNLIIQTFSKK